MSEVNATPAAPEVTEATIPAVEAAPATTAETPVATTDAPPAAAVFVHTGETETNGTPVADAIAAGDHKAHVFLDAIEHLVKLVRDHL